MSLQIEAVILAGGKASRMGGADKGLIMLGDKPLIQYCIDRIWPQVDRISISANRNQDTYAGFGLEVLRDDTQGFLGPLAGMVTALKRSQADYVLMVPCDCPLLPTDLVPRMLEAIIQTNAELAVASDGEREQSAILLLPPTLGASMQAFLDGGDRKIALWYGRHNTVSVAFTDDPAAFTNLNTREQLAQFLAEKKRG
jgi:molybdenum cofactor guanylyltransferase